MVSAISPLAGMNLQGQQVDLAGSLLAGRDAYQGSQLNQQAIKQNEQQIARADYEQGVERLKLINRLAVKVKQLPQDQRGGFVNSLNQDMLKSVGIDPAQISTVQLDDQSLDALIAQTGAAIPEGSQYRKESVNTNRGLQVYDPSTGTYTQAKDEQGRPLSGAQYDPSLQEEISTARQTGANQSDLEFKPVIAGEIAQRQADVDLANKPEIERQIAAAKSASERKTKQMEAGDKYGALISGFEGAKAIIPLSTGSTLGALKNQAGQIIGYSSEAAQNTARLKSLAAWLITQVPKPGGGVSDADLVQFKNAVGSLDDNTPPEERMAALDTAMKIVEKFQSVTGADDAKKSTNKYKVEIIE